MDLSLTVGPLTPDEMSRAITALAQAGLTGAGAQAGAQQAPRLAGAPPPPPAGAPVPQAAPPPPPAPPAQPASNTKLDQVLKLMDAYSRAGHQVAGARKVLALLGLSRAQDANEEQLDWLAQAFANTAWAP